MENTTHAPVRPEIGDVRSSINYMVAMAQKPARYLCTPPPGAPELNWQLESQSVQVHDGRPRLSLLSIEKQGFTLRREETTVTDFYDHEQVLDTYYPEVEQLVREMTGARKVLAFDSTCGTGQRPSAERPERFRLPALCTPITHRGQHHNACATCSPHTRRKSHSGDGMRSSTCGDRSKDRCRTRHWRYWTRSQWSQQTSSRRIYCILTG